MTRLEERRLDSVQFKRRKATDDTKRKIVDWEIWECAGPQFQHSYDRTVSLFVHEGIANLTFENGETVGIEPGDFLTIEEGTIASWEIAEPVKNSFSYHDTFVSASSRDTEKND